MKNVYYYKVLNLSPGATLPEVKAAYRRMAKKYHPDVTGLGSTGIKFREIVKAYRTIALSQPGNKEIFNETRTTRTNRGGFAERSHVLSRISKQGKVLIRGEIPALRRNAAVDLGETGKKAAYGFLRLALWDSSEEVVIAVINSIIKLKVRQAIGELGTLFVKSRRLVKLSLLKAINKSGEGNLYHDIILLALRDSDPLVRKTGQSIST